MEILLILKPLRSAPVALLWGGLQLSALGDQLYAVALTWIGVGVLGANAGYVSALQALVILLAVLGIGRWVDRWEERRSMIAADLRRAAVLLVVVAVWLNSGGPNVAQLVAAVVALAIGQAVFQPALQAVLPLCSGGTWRHRGTMKDIPAAVLRQTRLEHGEKAATMRA